MAVDFGNGDKAAALRITKTSTIKEVCREGSDKGRVISKKTLEQTSEEIKSMDVVSKDEMYRAWPSTVYHHVSSINSKSGAHEETNKTEVLTAPVR